MLTDNPYKVEGPAGCGNCVGCFMKGKETLIAIEQQHPGSLKWYAEKEKQIGGTFRPPSKRIDYASMIDVAERQGVLFEPEDNSIDCMCTD